MQHDLFSVEDRVIVVTGAASGIGRAIALGLAVRGAQVALADLNQAGLDEVHQTAVAAGATVWSSICNVAAADSVAALFAGAEASLGPVAGLVHCAGILPERHHPEAMPLAAWQRIMDINLVGSFLCAQECGRRMIAGGSGGSIVLVSSIAGASALGRGNLAYSAGKAAVNQLTRELAVEWAGNGIRVNALLPCQIRTPAVRTLFDDPRLETAPLQQRVLSGIAMQRLGEPEELVGPAIFLLSSAASLVTGVLLPVDGGNLALNAGGSTSW